MANSNYHFKILETDRLYLRHLIRDDAEFILRLLNEPSWLEFIGDKHVSNLNDAKKYIELSAITLYQQFGFGLFLVSNKDNDLPLGLCGLIKRDDLEHADLGYAFLPEFWQQGFALEAVNSVLHYAKHEHQLTKLLALTKSSNKPSINLLNKVNFQFDRDLKLLDDEENLHIYELSL